MRVRSKDRASEQDGGRLRVTVPTRRARPAREIEPEMPARAPAPEDDDLADERRLRASGGPDDRARYTCGCGYVFEADVSASVACPHCGAAQAW